MKSLCFFRSVKELNTGNIIFVQGKGIVSRIIRYFDKGDYSHVAIAVDYDYVIEADVDTKVSARFFDPNKYSKITVIDLGLDESKSMHVINEALLLVGTKYDYLQLVWYGLRKLFNIKGKNKLNNPRNVICSELVFIVLSKAGILDELGIDYKYYEGIDLTPNELYDLVEYVSVKTRHYN